jgi:hypothetical protein
LSRVEKKRVQQSWEQYLEGLRDGLHGQVERAGGWRRRPASICGAGGEAGDEGPPWLTYVVVTSPVSRDASGELGGAARMDAGTHAISGEEANRAVVVAGRAPPPLWRGA